MDKRQDNIFITEKGQGLKTHHKELETIRQEIVGRCMVLKRNASLKTHGKKQNHARTDWLFLKIK